MVFEIGALVPFLDRADQVGQVPDLAVCGVSRMPGLDLSNPMRPERLGVVAGDRGDILVLAADLDKGLNRVAPLPDILPL